MKTFIIGNNPAPAPVKEPTTRPAEPGTSPSPGIKPGNDPWDVPVPSILPQPKAIERTQSTHDFFRLFINKKINEEKRNFYRKFKKNTWR